MMNPYMEPFMDPSLMGQIMPMQQPGGGFYPPQPPIYNAYPGIQTSPLSSNPMMSQMNFPKTRMTVTTEEEGADGRPVYKETYLDITIFQSAQDVNNLIKQAMDLVNSRQNQ